MTAPETALALSRLPEYKSWVAMVRRCSDRKNPSYAWYGGAGITVHPDWIGSGGYERFLRHVGRRPGLRYSIDRIDNAGHYEPGNVRWATSSEQARNRSDNRLVTFRGETLCMVDWAARLSLTIQGMQRRLNEWPLEEALTAPSRGRVRVKVLALHKERPDLSPWEISKRAGATFSYVKKVLEASL